MAKTRARFRDFFTNNNFNFQKNELCSSLVCFGSFSTAKFGQKKKCFVIYICVRVCVLNKEMNSKTESKVEKARFCTKCKKILPLVCFTDANNITKEDNAICDKHGPEAQGLRYCRGCEDFVALDLFPRGCRPGYACRKHVNEFGGGQETWKKRMSDPNTKRRTWQWKMCYNDAKTFKQTIFTMSQKEIELEITKVDKHATGKYLIMPIDIHIPISPLNLIVVSVEQRKNLMKLVTKGDLLEYTRIITEIHTTNML